MLASLPSKQVRDTSLYIGPDGPQTRAAVVRAVAVLGILTVAVVAFPSAAFSQTSQVPLLSVQPVQLNDVSKLPPDSQSVQIGLAPAPLAATHAQVAVLPPEKHRQPQALVPMYFAFAGLQVLDYHSTTQALSTSTGHESNPVTRELVESHGAILAAKAAATGMVVFAGQQMSKHHPRAAVMFVGALNVTMAAVVAHNYSVSRR